MSETMSVFTEQPDALLVDVLVAPRASKNRIGPIHGDRLKLAVTAPPVDGAANKAIVGLLAGALSIPKRDVEVVSGQSSRRKTVRLRGCTRRQLEAVIA
jgi:uncharacterized protein (TIGR00251 family)